MAGTTEDLGFDAALGPEGIDFKATNLQDASAPSPAPAGGADGAPTAAEDEEDDKARRKERIEALRKVCGRWDVHFSQLPIHLIMLSFSDFYCCSTLRLMTIIYCGWSHWVWTVDTISIGG